ncbi:hypothetical protein WR25_10183 isoform B [Diploscapter pachys]|uniref:Uncharacterized protein n=1 Tax=Diploscapter pachys TaxID=2018661 RepID=A0A2A2KLZ8_9BILA|nr:hypothetical protein WR25_10183 isoform B [Diploscapter pachys]
MHKDSTLLQFRSPLYIVNNNRGILLNSQRSISHQTLQPRVLAWAEESDSACIPDQATCQRNDEFRNSSVTLQEFELLPHNARYGSTSCVNHSWHRYDGVHCFDDDSHHDLHDTWLHFVHGDIYNDHIQYYNWMCPRSAPLAHCNKS